MNKSRLLGAVCATVFTFITLPSHAALSYVLGGLAVYDDVADLSWTTNANINGGQMTWDAANTWAQNLTVGGVGGWRLPTTLQPDRTCGTQIFAEGFPDQGFGYHCTGSEMGNLYNEEGVTAASMGLFDSVQSDYYWSSTEYAPNTGDAWVFYFNHNWQNRYNKDLKGYAWAVQSGNVVPIPASVWLFGSGLLGLVGMARRKTLKR